MKSIILIGFMGSGKSTVGRYLAQACNIKQIDTDWLIEKTQARKISDIFKEDGEEAFREMETECVRSFLGRNTAYVISVGGGLPMREVNREILHKLGDIVYLKADISTLENRLAGDKKRPLLQDGDIHEKISNLMQRREGTYEELADIIVCTDDKSIDQVVEEIIRGVGL